MGAMKELFISKAEEISKKCGLDSITVMEMNWLHEPKNDTEWADICRNIGDNLSLAKEFNKKIYICNGKPPCRGSAFCGFNVDPEDYWDCGITCFCTLREDYYYKKEEK